MIWFRSIIRLEMSFCSDLIENTVTCLEKTKTAQNSPKCRFQILVSEKNIKFTQVSVVLGDRKHGPDGLNDTPGGEPIHAPLQGVDQFRPFQRILAFKICEKWRHFWVLLIWTVARRERRVFLDEWLSVGMWDRVLYIATLWLLIRFPMNTNR